MVTVRVDYLFTGACHAPVSKTKKKVGKGADGKLWLDGEITVNCKVGRRKDPTKQGKIRDDNRKRQIAVVGSDL